MVGRRAGAGLALAAIALIAAGCGLGGSTTTVTSTVTRTVTTTRTVTQSSGAASPCTGDQLSGTFAVVPGSGGAGQISYALTLTNTSGSTCSLFGVPEAQLLSASGPSPPTTIVLVQESAPQEAATLSPGGSTVVQARFSPSVPGSGDSQSGPCQPKAYTLRVAPNGGGAVDAPIRPPTSVCQLGTLNFDVFVP